MLLCFRWSPSAKVEFSYGYRSQRDSVEFEQNIHSSRKIAHSPKLNECLNIFLQFIVNFILFGRPLSRSVVRLNVKRCRKCLEPTAQLPCVFRVKTHLTHSALLFTFAFTCNSNIYRERKKKKPERRTENLFAEIGSYVISMFIQ